jgi:NADH-quinone oxidoreductase subunit C
VAQQHNQAPPEDSPPDFDQLSQSRRDLLALAEDVFRQFQPQPGVLNDLPQLTLDPGSIPAVCQLAKEDPRLDFKMLLCLACVDYETHFQMVYFLQSLTHEQTLVLKADVAYQDPGVPSVTSVWEAADWYEREAHDLFGVSFAGHPGLSPLLLYEEFVGFPGRKEYPLNDYEEF